MNLLPLLAALVPWAPTPLGAFLRVYAACSLLSIEVQVLTWWKLGTLETLVPWNLGLAACVIGSQLYRRAPAFRWTAGVWAVAPRPALAALALGVTSLNLWLPLEAADPYQLDRVAQIERLGTLAYDVTSDPKVNIAGAFYELMVADLRQLAGIGPGVVRLHGLVGLGLYVLALAAITPWLGAPATGWARAALLVVPTVFHQLVLIKNDLFLGLAGVVALVWATHARANDAIERWRNIAWAAWLVGLAVGSKQVNAPLVLAFGLGVWLGAGPGGAGAALAFAGGGAFGGVCAGLVLAFAQNAETYGDILASGPLSEMDRLNTGAADVAMSLVRFTLSLGDLGLVTPNVWPGRGGWGGTFGLPFVWALAVLAWRAWPKAGGAEVGPNARVRHVVVCAAAHLAVFGALFPDSDLCHRLVLAPGLLVVVTALHTSPVPPWARSALPPVVVLSAIQMMRSAVLYGLRP
jgi:hypothetical protein